MSEVSPGPRTAVVLVRGAAAPGAGTGRTDAPSGQLSAYGTAPHTNGAAYTDAVSEYAALGRDELREAARAVMAVTSGRG
ncbi:hypothetical protein [Streptomyces sp. NPDC002845]